MATPIAKACPFCGEVPNTWDFMKLDECYTLAHHCPHEGEHLTVCTNVYGKSMEDVVDIWNHRCDEEGGHNDNTND